MPRRKKTDDDDKLNESIGERLRALRLRNGWTLAELGGRVGLSISHVNALESGTNSFHAPLLKKLSDVFQEPVTYFLASEPPPVQGVAAQWGALFERVPERDRLLLLDLANKIVDWTADSNPHRHAGMGPAKLLVLEGIDGALVRELGAAIARATRAVHCDHDYTSDLWHHMIERLRSHVAMTEARDRNAKNQAMERTLLFTCERFERQESAVRRALDAGLHAVVPFSAMASEVYQEAEGFSDRRLIHIVNTLLLKPDAFIILYSDPRRAAAKAVTAVPREGQFFSLNTLAELEHAQKLYRRAADEFRGLGRRVHEVEVSGDSITEDLLKSILGLISDMMPIARAPRPRKGRSRASGASAPKGAPRRARPR